MCYDPYKITGDIFDDRQNVANALDDPSLTFEQKEAIVQRHNWHHDDFMSTDSYMNRIRYNVSTDPPPMYGSFHVNAKPRPEDLRLELSRGDLLFDDPNA